MPSTAAMPIPCGPYLQGLLTRAVDRLDAQTIPAWDEEGRRNLHRLRQGHCLPYWTGSRGRRHLARIEFLAAAALTALASEAQGPAWANTEAADAQRLADAIHEGRCAIW
jgi:hypothetical protein